MKLISIFQVLTASGLHYVPAVSSIDHEIVVYCLCKALYSGSNILCMKSLFHGRVGIDVYGNYVLRRFENLLHLSLLLKISFLSAVILHSVNPRNYSLTLYPLFNFKITKWMVIKNKKLHKLSHSNSNQLCSTSTHTDLFHKHANVTHSHKEIYYTIEGAKISNYIHQWIQKRTVF